MSIRGPSVKRLRRLLGRIAADNRGATAIEYGLIVACIVIAMVVTLVQVANTTSGIWNNVNDKVTAAR
jgi:pilus assembly protein Flp/PilA